MNRSRGASLYIATCLKLGNLPFPGVWGTSIGILVSVILRSSPTFRDNYLAVIALLISTIFVFLAVSGRGIFKGDPKEIIIDETCGFLVATLFFPNEVKWLIFSFVLFRVFDDLKPFPIKMVENLSDSISGVFIDDVIAGIYTGVVMYFLVRFEI